MKGRYLTQEMMDFIIEKRKKKVKFNQLALDFHKAFNYYIHPSKLRQYVTRHNRGWSPQKRHLRPFVIILRKSNPPREALYVDCEKIIEGEKLTYEDILLAMRRRLHIGKINDNEPFPDTFDEHVEESMKKRVHKFGCKKHFYFKY